MRKATDKLRGIFRSATAVLAAVAIGLVASTGIQADDTKSPYLQPDDSWISISGTVDVVNRDSFMLDYGDGAVLVEMDDGDRDADAYKLLEGDKVTVTGVIDDDFFEMTKIEASSVYVENLGTTFFASAIDEEDYELWDASAIAVLPVSRTIVRGTVTNVNGDEFEIATGLQLIQVDVSDMPYNPLDDEGYLKIEKGDRVKVVGEMDDDLFEGRELMADSVIKLYGS